VSYATTDRNRARFLFIHGTADDVGAVRDPDFEYAMIDGTIIKVHRHGTGAKGGLRVKP
jgi:hypothetical protein